MPVETINSIENGISFWCFTMFVLFEIIIKNAPNLLFNSVVGHFFVND